MKVMTMRIAGSEVRVGDDVIFLGTPHRVTSVEPYSHPVATGGEQWAIAYAATPERPAKGNAWAITLEPHCDYDITRVVAP